MITTIDTFLNKYMLVFSPRLNASLCVDKLEIWTPNILGQVLVNNILIIEFVEKLVVEVEIKPPQLYLEKQVNQ